MRIWDATSSWNAFEGISDQDIAVVPAKTGMNPGREPPLLVRRSTWPLQPVHINYLLREGLQTIPSTSFLDRFHDVRSI